MANAGQRHPRSGAESLDRIARSATAHRLATDEAAGMVLGTALGWGTSHGSNTCPRMTWTHCGSSLLA